MLLWLSALWHYFGLGRIDKRKVAGQGLVEYALILLFVAIVVMVVVGAVGNTLCTNWYAQLMNNSVFGSGSALVSCDTGP
jgi:Flp pilus assembly pilin Flp